MPCIMLSDSNFQEEALESKEPVLVEFVAKWSGPCHVIAPGLRETENRYSSRVKFCKLDIDDYPETAKLYGVQSVPTILMFRAGRLMDHTVGVVPKTVIAQKLDALLGLVRSSETVEIAREIPEKGITKHDRSQMP